MAVEVSYRNVVKRYAGQSEPAVRDLSLEVAAGEICVLVGPSGCGKTTAMRMVNRTVTPMCQISTFSRRGAAASAANCSMRR